MKIGQFYQQTNHSPMWSEEYVWWNDFRMRVVVFVSPWVQVKVQESIVYKIKKKIFLYIYLKYRHEKL